MCLFVCSLSDHGKTCGIDPSVAACGCWAAVGPAARSRAADPSAGRPGTGACSGAHGAPIPAVPRPICSLQYCPHCLAAGGPGRVSDDDRLIWPVGVNGFCGDMYYKDGVRPIVDPQRDHEAGGRFATGAPPNPPGASLPAVPVSVGG